jgi:hypothetical protein
MREQAGQVQRQQRDAQSQQAERDEEDPKEPAPAAEDADDEDRLAGEQGEDEHGDNRPRDAGEVVGVERGLHAADEQETGRRAHDERDERALQPARRGSGVRIHHPLLYARPAMVSLGRPRSFEMMSYRHHERRARPPVSVFSTGIGRRHPHLLVCAAHDDSMYAGAPTTARSYHLDLLSSSALRSAAGERPLVAATSPYIFRIP